MDGEGLAGSGELPPESYRYFYVSYTLGGGAFGCKILRQIRGAEDHGMNIAGAHQILLDQFNSPAIVISWHETNLRRYTQFMAFAQSLAGKFGKKADGPALTIHHGEGIASTPRAGNLRAVTPEDPGPPEAPPA